MGSTCCKDSGIAHIDGVEAAELGADSGEKALETLAVSNVAVTGVEASSAECAQVSMPPAASTEKVDAPVPEPVKNAVVEEAAVAESFQEEGVARPNFTGNWKLVKIDGDMDAFMKELGLGWMIRKAASSMSYGIGKSFNIIEHTGDTIKVENQNPGGGAHVQKYRIDGTEQDDVLPRENTAIKLVPTWEDVGGAPAIAIRVRRVDDPKKGMPMSRRYMFGATMVVESTSPSGLVTKRIFEKS